MMVVSDGIFRRLARKFSEEEQPLQMKIPVAQTLSDYDEFGARACIDCKRGEEVTIVGRIRSIQTRSKEDRISMEAECFDGTEELELIWIGRRRIAGIEPGKRVLVRGRVGERNHKKVIFNPYYELFDEA